MSRTRSIGHVAMALFCTLIAAPLSFAQDTFVRLPRIAIEDNAAAPAALDAVLRAAPAPVPLMIRVTADLESAAPAVDARLAQHAARRIPVWLALPAPTATDAVERWQTALQSLLSKHRDAIAIVEISLAEADAKLAAYVLRIAATTIRAEREAIRVAIGGAAVAAAWPSLYTPDLAPYLDLLVIPAAADLAAAASLLERLDPGAQMAVTAGDAGPDAAQATRRLLDSELETMGTTVILHAWQPSEALVPALAALGSIAPMMAGQVVALDEAAANLRLATGDRNAAAAIRHRLLFDERSFATYLVYWGDVSSDLLDISLTLPVEGTPGVRRLLDGSPLPVSDYRRAPDTGLASLRVPLAGGPVLINFSEGAAVTAQRSDVAAERLLTVEEVIARHQQQQRRQDALVRTYIANARMDQHFRPTMTDPGYDVASENRYFVAGAEVEWEELSFSVNGTKWGPDRPAFPLLQAEKVLSLPLQLRFDSDYQYRLGGVERVGDYDCYVVRFDPVATGRSLYRGTVWIERRTFARVKVQAVQTTLSAPVVSNEEIQTYSPVATVGGQPVFLFSALTARQIVLIAGRNLLVEKSVAFSAFKVNPADFEGSRNEARRSDRIMYRETDRGLRYLVKEGDQRVVSERATRSARAMAIGVTLDPSYAFPLPIFGINYLDFEFRGPDSQLAILFAGVLAAGNVQRPKLRRTPLDASVDFFAIAVPSSDRVYDAAGEYEGERLLTWPLTTGANLGWQYTPFQKLSAQYQFRFDGYVRDTTTSESYVVPASTVTNGIGGSWEYRRGGYSAVVNGTWFRRAGWRAWGEPDAAPPALRPRYAKYSASLSRDFYFNVFHKIHLNAAWFGGRGLDRFNKYQFGLFDDTRIHGVPASGLRFEQLGMIRGSYSFNIFEQYRLDLFLERAWGRDRAFDTTWQSLTGIGAAVNMRAPWSTILRVDGGKSLVPDRYRTIGSATLQVMILKPLR